MQVEKMREKLKSVLKPSRYEHSIGVMNTALKLAQHFGEDENKAVLCGLLHDCAKYMNSYDGYEFCNQKNIKLDDVSKNNYAIVHQYTGAYIAKYEYGVCDADVLNAIACHTTGKAGMTNLDKILFLADMIEPNRKKNPYIGLDELEKLAFENLDKAMVFGLDLSINHIMTQGFLVHLDSVRARNDIITKNKLR